MSLRHIMNSIMSLGLIITHDLCLSHIIIHDLCLSHIITHDFCLRLSKIINPTDKIKNDTGKEYFEKTIKDITGCVEVLTSFS